MTGPTRNFKTLPNSKETESNGVWKMVGFIRTVPGRTGHFEYKGCRVEIFTGKKGMQWTWAFVVNGTEAKASGNQYCKTAALAINIAKTEACRFIDKRR